MIVKITILLILVTMVFVFAFKVWANDNPFSVYREKYPLWAYIIPILTIFDIMGIFASVIWLLCFYW